MYKIYADYNRIFLDSWNQAYGNKILHLLFLINACEKKNRQPVMYKGSNLDALFNFNFEIIDNAGPVIDDYYFIEPDPYAVSLNGWKDRIRLLLSPDLLLDKVINEACKTYNVESKLLNDLVLPDKDISIKGHFFEYDLMPSLEIFNKYISINANLINELTSKYDTLLDNRAVAVHYRGTDFNHHLRHIFKSGISVDNDYYNKSIDLVEKYLGKDVVFHLFSDDMGFLFNIFKNKNIVVHDDDAIHDWASIFMMKNVIQSNSSYCWTASLYNKSISIQPNHGYNYHRQTGSIPFKFAHSNAQIIK